MAKSGPGVMLLIGKGKPGKGMPPVPPKPKKKAPKLPPMPGKKSPMKGGSKKLPPFMNPGGMPPGGGLGM